MPFALARLVVVVVPVIVAIGDRVSVTDQLRADIASRSITKNPASYKRTTECLGLPRI
jgi:hypothetical protein